MSLTATINICTPWNKIVSENAHFLPIEDAIAEKRFIKYKLLKVFELKQTINENINLEYYWQYKSTDLRIKI